MKNEPQNLHRILDRVSGYHQLSLAEPVRLTYVSRSFCDMTGFSEEELLEDVPYLQLVHPADRAAFSALVEKLAAAEQTLTLQYRLLKKDGSVIFVSDTTTASRLEDGMLGDSVLTDITKLKNENQNLRFLNDTAPCGFLKYTCEKTPRVTYINDQMLRILRFPEESESGYDFLETYRQNIYTMIPMEERGRFARYLERVYRLGAPLAGEMSVLRCDGTKAYLFGWVTKCVNEQGIEEFQSACMDITQRHLARKERESQRYLKALTDIYETVIEYDLSNRTVTCLHGSGTPAFQWIENVPMQMEEATEKWITATVWEEDRERLRAFFRDFYDKQMDHADGQPPQISYRAMSANGKQGTYRGIFLKIDGAASLFCSRNMPDDQENDALRLENTTLKNMQQLVMRFTEGVVAFEVENDTVKPLYTSENVCSFFGYTNEEWLSLAEKRPTIQEFISQSGIDYADIQRLFAAGEAGFTYFDMTRNSYRRIKAICSQKYSGGDTKCYVMLYNVEDRQPEPARSGASVYIRTFGYFDVFVDDRPIAFRNEKSKELFALLTDRRGGFISSEEAIAFLWEDEPATPVTLARYRKVALRLKNILEEYGISDIVESINGKRRLATEKVRCDLYDYLTGREEFAQLFKGSYLTNYSWGESTLAALLGEHIN